MSEPEFHKFPLWLNHPHERPAVVSDDYDVGSHPPLGYHAAPGRPAQFPPVQVHDEDQLEYYESRGYIARVGNRDHAMSAIIAPKPVDYTHREYPRIAANGRVETDPFAEPPPDPRYPKWVRREGFEDALVKSEAEEKALLAAPPPMPPRSDVEGECMAQIMAAAGDPVATVGQAGSMQIASVSERTLSPAPKRGRGRPKGAKTRPKSSADAEAAQSEAAD